MRAELVLDWPIRHCSGGDKVLFKYFMLSRVFVVIELPEDYAVLA